MRVGIARRVEPVDGHALPITRRREQTVHALFVRVGRFVGQELVEFGKRGWQSGEIERDTAQQQSTIGRGRGSQPFLLEPGEHEIVNRIPHPTRVPNYRHRWPFRRDERPVRPPVRALLDPGPQCRDFLIGERRASGVGRRHAHGRLCGSDAFENLTGGGIARHDYPLRAVFRIQAQTNLSRGFIRTVASEAAVGQNWSHITREIDARSGGQGNHGPEGNHEFEEVSQQTDHIPYRVELASARANAASPSGSSPRTGPATVASSNRVSVLKPASL